MYDPKSMKAEEFISHEEILDTLAYAQENKSNEKLIDAILEKAKLHKGLSHREASCICPITVSMAVCTALTMPKTNTLPGKN